MSLNMREVVSEEIINVITVDGEDIGTVQFSGDNGYHAMIKIHDNKGLHSRLAQGFGETKEIAIKNTIEEGMKEAKEYLTQLELLYLSLYET